MFFKTKSNRAKKQDEGMLVMVAVLFVVISASGVAIFHYAQAYAEKMNAPIEIKIDPNLGIEPYVVEFFTDNDAEEMLPIIECESQFRHYDVDGNVLINSEGSSAIGVAQILTSKHPDVKALEKYNRVHNTDLAPSDFNLESLRGNLGYALLLYEIRGTKDWECAHKV